MLAFNTKRGAEVEVGAEKQFIRGAEEVDHDIYPLDPANCLIENNPKQP